jgi:hypothetical protein
MVLDTGFRRYDEVVAAGISSREAVTPAEAGVQGNTH